MPTRARNGARIVLRSIVALMRAICASATSRAARVLSTSSADTARCSLSFVHARELRLRELGLRFERFQLGLLDGDVERDEDGAFLDDLTRLERDTAHRAGQLIANADRTRRDDSADRRRHGSVLALLRDGRLHGFHGLGLMGRGGIRIFERGMFPGRERAARSNHCNHQNDRSNSCDSTFETRLPAKVGT